MLFRKMSKIDFSGVPLRMLDAYVFSALSKFQTAVIARRAEDRRSNLKVEIASLPARHLYRLTVGRSVARNDKNVSSGLNRYLNAAFISIIIFLNSGFSFDSGIWQKSTQGIYESDIRSMLVDPENDEQIYAGTSNALYKSSDGGRTYQAVLRPSGEQKGVNDIYISPDLPERIYAATDAGLYLTPNDGQTWDRIYYSSDSESRQCLSIIRHNNMVYLGTRKGLFQKTDQETNWQKIKEGLDNKPVYHSVQDGQFLYFATGQTLFRFDKQTHKIKNIFSMGISESSEENGASEEELTNRGDQRIQFIEVSKPPQSYLVVASSKGIFFSSNYGQDWKNLPSDNLALESLTSLLILENNAENEEQCLEASLGCLKLLAGTEKGVFFLNNEKWMPLYKGMETNKISYLAKDKRRTVYAATAKGIYFFPTEETLPLSHKTLGTQELQVSADTQWGVPYEPSINDVHQMAIEYAEVNPEKIANWRELARKRALMPALSVGLDREATDLLHWDTGASPDELQKGREYIDWDVSVSWNLADLVWSTDQTTIDSRSKLMVELREDILDEVTRLYFERRRIQTELIMDNFPDTLSKTDKEMRVSELTALIDALTGGEFSKRIVNN